MTQIDEWPILRLRKSVVNMPWSIDCENNMHEEIKGRLVSNNQLQITEY